MVLFMASNDEVIERFRSNHGLLSGPWEGKRTLLLHTRGRKTGTEFVNPLVAAPYDKDSYLVCGSMWGTPEDPQWFANLEATNGPVIVEFGSETREASHREVRPGRDEEWKRLYGLWRAYWPDAAGYEKNTDRKFPVAVITLL